MRRLHTVAVVRAFLWCFFGQDNSTARAAWAEGGGGEGEAAASTGRHPRGGHPGTSSREAPRRGHSALCPARRASAASPPAASRAMLCRVRELSTLSRSTRCGPGPPARTQRALLLSWAPAKPRSASRLPGATDAVVLPCGQVDVIAVCAVRSREAPLATAHSRNGDSFSERVAAAGVDC